MSDDPQKGIGANLDRKQKRPAVVTALLLLALMLGMGLRLYELDADSMWYDEVITTEQAQQDLSSILTYYGGNEYTHPPLVHLLTRFFITVAGNSDFVLRAQAMLLGSVAILLTYKVGEVLWTRGVGLVGSVLLAVNAYHVHYSQEARSYALMVFLALLSLFFLCKALQRNEKRFWLGFILCTSLGLYNHYFAALFLPAEVVFAACVIAQNRICHRRRNGHALGDHASHGPSLPARQSLLFFLSLTVVGLSYIPWLPALRTHIAFFTGYQGEPVAAVGSLESSLSFLHTMLKQYSGVSGVALLLWVGMFVLGLAACDLKRMALVASWVGTPLVFLAFVQSGYPSKPRYVLFILPLILLVIARGITSAAGALGSFLPAARGDRKGPVPSIVTLTVLIFASLSVAPLRDHYSWQKDDWRGAARYLADNMEPGDIVMADGIGYRLHSDSETVVRCLSYYMAAFGLRDARILRVDRGLWGELQSLAEGDREAWAVVFHPNRPARGERTKGITLVNFANVSIVRLQQPSGRLLEDSESLLHVLLNVLPSKADFDVHLALADIHQQTGSCEQASLALYRASRVKPEGAAASEDLSEAAAEWEEVCSGRENLEHPLWLNLGDLVACLGYEVAPHSAQAGGTLQVTIWWQTLDRMDRDYSVFVHLVDGEGHLWSQQDQLLQRGEHPTSTWAVGATVVEDYKLELAPDMPPGEYVVQAGIYYWETGERLAARDLDARRLADDVIPLGVVNIGN